MGLCEEIASRIADPGRVAVREQAGHTWSWDGLLGAAEDLAERLRPRGPQGPLRLAAVRTGRPVQTLVATLACDLLQVPLMHLDSGQPEAEYARVTAAFGPHLLLADPRPDDAEPGPVWERYGLSFAVSASGGDGGGAAFPSPRSGIFLTSGSTGEPSGAVRSMRAQIVDSLRCAEAMGYGPSTPVVCAAPVFHLYGHTLGLLAPLLSGAPVTLCGSRVVPSQIAAAVRDSGARVLIALPFHYRLMAADTTSRFDGLERALSAGAPIPSGAAAAVMKEHGFALLNMYGCSEAGAITVKPVDPEADRPGDVGQPLPGIVATLREADEEDGAGELQLATETLADGYAHVDGVRPLSLNGDLLRTGDLAKLGPDGSIKLIGRLARMINVGGKKVNPVEVERVLAEHPAVTDAQVFAEADGGRGQVPVARVAAPGPVTADELIRWCQERLMEHKIPRRIQVTAELPRSTTGKVLAPRPAAPGPEAGPEHDKEGSA